MNPKKLPAIDPPNGNIHDGRLREDPTLRNQQEYCSSSTVLVITVDDQVLKLNLNNVMRVFRLTPN